jgi:hypothetical protein
MKTPVRIFLATALISTLFWGCSKNESSTDSSSLKQSIARSSANLNQAMVDITSSKAYSILTIPEGTLKSSESSTSDSVYRVYITLDQIKGKYDFHPVIKHDKWGLPLINYFVKTADDNQMVVYMPLVKITNPKSLLRFSPSDTTLTNNFAIAVSQYHNNYNGYHDFDYLLASEISIDNASEGSLNIKSFKSPKSGIHYASEYAFSGSYTAKYKYDSGDTTVSSFAIMSGDNVLYREELLTIKNDTARFGHEKQYSLTIGDVKIVKKAADTKAEVYLAGVLQPNAVITIIDKETDPEASVCKKRDIQITFDDGTTTTVSALIGSSVADIKTLFESLHQVYFAAYIVDWIAYDIYYHRN